MRTPLRVLIAEDSPDDAELLLMELARGGFEPVSQRVESAAEMRAALADNPWEIVLSDHAMPGFGASAALALCRETDPDLPFVVVSGTIGEEWAVEMMRAGASDFLLKSSLARLVPVVERELREAVNHRAQRRAMQLVSRLAAIVESSEDAIISCRLDGTITDFNAGAERLYGYRAEEIVGQVHPPFVPPDDGNRRLAILAQVGRGERVAPVEAVRYRRDGTRLDVSVSISPIRDGEGRVVGVSNIIRDITAQKQAETALHASQERFQAFMDNSPAAADVKDEDGRFLYVNAAWLRNFGPEPIAWQGKTNYDFWPRETADLFRASDELCLARNEAIQMEETGRKASGAEQTLMVMKFPIVGGGRRQIGGIAWDITDRKQAEKALQSSQQRLRHVLGSSPAVLFTLLVADGKILGVSWTSDNVQEMLGYTPAEALVPGWWLEHVHPEGREDLVSNTDAVLFEEGFMAREFRFRHADGQYRWIRSEVRLIHDETGVPVEAVGAWSDVTARKLLEDQYHQAQKMDAFGQLAGGVAHDFNNLLTVINGYSELLLQSIPQEDPSWNLLAEIHRAGERSASLTRQLLAFSRQQMLAPQVLNLNEVVNDIDKMLRRLIGEDVRLTTTLDSKPWAVHADPGQVEQVLLNLAVNARDAMPKGGRLTIETHNVELDETYARTHKEARAGQHVLLSVTDTGSGMAPEVMAKIFEPFFTTKAPGKGTGLGLATVYGIVKQSGGHVAVYSEIGLGTTFKVYFPRVEKVAKSSKSAPGARLPPRGTETVLLAEDEAGVRTLTRHVLTGCGYQVLEAGDGDEALRLAAAHDGPIHLLITDVVMPGAGGRAVAEELIERHTSMRVLYMSGYTDDAVIRHGVLGKGINFLQKPFTPTALTFKVREVLDAPIDDKRDP